MRLYRVGQRPMAVGTTCSAGTCSGSTIYSYTVGYTGDGDVLSATDIVNGTWAYTYDDFNRLLTSNCSVNCPDGSPPPQGFSYGYDRYGNRWNQTLTAGSGFNTYLTFNGPGNVPNNRIDGYSYDAAGNLLNDTFHSYSYDAENRLISVDGTTTYVYDAQDRRVSKTAGSSVTDFIYDREGHIILTDTPAPRIETYVAGLHLGTYILNSAGTDTVFYYDHSDWLGTERARVSLSGTECEKIVSLPFGDGQTVASTCGDISPMHFTGKERDSESGLDMFGARYNNSALGRFMTPDWAAKPITVPYAKFGDPQTLNLYTYVENGPLNRIDPDGHDDGAPSGGDSGGGQANQVPGNAGQATNQTPQPQQPAQNTQSLAAQVPPAAKAAIANALNASNSPTADDKKGGFHEESVKWGTDASGNVIVSPSVPGAYAPPGTNPNTNFTPANPQTDQNLSTVDAFAHIHPKGGGDRSFVQGPSAADLKFAGQSSAINLVVGAADKKVYFFNGSGVIGSPMKLKDFMGGSQ
jgi:RHS repeat-associated protein